MVNGLFIMWQPVSRVSISSKLTFASIPTRPSVSAANGTNPKSSAPRWICISSQYCDTLQLKHSSAASKEIEYMELIYYPRKSGKWVATLFALRVYWIYGVPTSMYTGKVEPLETINPRDIVHPRFNCAGRIIIDEYKGAEK